MIPLFFSVLLFVAALANGLEDLRTCDDLDCSHTCDKTVTKCTCPVDLVLGADLKRCQEPVSLLLLTNTNTGLLKLTEGQSGNVFEPVITGRSYAFDVLHTSKEVYAFDGDKITRYSFPDSKLKAKDISKSPVVEVDSRVTSLVVDWKHSRLYWVCNLRSLIESCKTDGSDRNEVVSHPTEGDLAANWTNLAVDPYEEKLFWLGNRGLFVSDLKGKFTIARTTINQENLAVDIQTKHIYVVGYHGDKEHGKVIVRYYYDGRQADEIYLGQGGSSIYGLAVAGNQLFWVGNFDGEAVYRTALTSATNKNATVTLFEELYHVVTSLKIYKPNVQYHKNTK